MRKPIRVILAVICLACCATASAQVPTFAPYGAWRGRIRYVEGPWRTRSTIHWGNGVTPTGGQVMIHGLTAAENVLTNPDFLSKVTGLRDAEAVEKSETRNREIRAAIDDIRTTNQSIAKLNKSVLDAWGLEPTKYESISGESDDPSGDPEGPSVTALFDTFEGKLADLADLAAEMRLGAEYVIMNGQFGLENRGDLKFTSGQEETLSAMIAFAQNVAHTLKDVEVDPVEADDTPAAAIKVAEREFKRLVELCGEATSTSAAVKELGEQLVGESIDEEVVAEGIEFAENVANAIVKWGNPPSVDDGLFETVGAGATEAATETDS